MDWESSLELKSTPPLDLSRRMIPTSPWAYSTNRRGYSSSGPVAFDQLAWSVGYLPYTSSPL